MARYYGTVIGNRGEVSRLGSRDSGLRVTANGWNLGGEVIMGSRDWFGNGCRDVLHFHINTGSNNGGPRRLSITALEGGEIVLNIPGFDTLITLGRIENLIRSSMNEQTTGISGQDRENYTDTQDRNNYITGDNND
jgi:hypothetical protein